MILLYVNVYVLHVFFFNKGDYYYYTLDLPYNKFLCLFCKCILVNTIGICIFECAMGNAGFLVICSTSVYVIWHLISLPWDRGMQIWVLRICCLNISQLVQFNSIALLLKQSLSTCRTRELRVSYSKHETTCTVLTNY